MAVAALLGLGIAGAAAGLAAASATTKAATPATSNKPAATDATPASASTPTATDAAPASASTPTATDAAPASASTPVAPTFEAPQLSPCQLEHPQKLSVVSADCGVLTVPENPAKPAGRQIGLAFARVPAINRRKQPDPLFVIAGGPGMAATTFYAMTAPVFTRIHRDRDIVLLDQRGTGGSNPLNCQDDGDNNNEVNNDAVVAEAQRCLEQLRAKADVAQYTTSLAVNDLDRLRQVLGYDRINLYGVSYGTRVAQHYLRRFPEHSRALILDGVVPPELSLGADMAVDAEASLTRILARCAREVECKSQFGDPTQDYHDLWQSLQAHPAQVTVPDPATGEATHFEFTRFHLATVLRLSIYSAEPTALLPLLLHQAHESKDYSRLAGQFLLLSRSYSDAVAAGMNNTVACTEDLAFYNPRNTDRTKLENTFLGTAQLDALLAICRIWPHGPIDPDFHAPLHSAVPVLLLSGSDDPVTPPVYAERARHGLIHSLNVVLKDFGHGQIVAPCVDKLMGQFINRASVEGLDTSCTLNDRPMPFFTSLNGPPP